MHSLPKLPYSAEALSPLMSAETLHFHHGKHHKGYVNKLNELVAGTRYQDKELPEILRGASGAILDNAAQHFNHSFFWQCLRPTGGPGPHVAVVQAIERRWGSFDLFRQEFTVKALALFGSGWCWLVAYPDGWLAVEATANAGCPLADGRQPLLTVDLWEHAYYIDHRNSRKRYLEAFWKLANWEVAERQLRLPAEADVRTTAFAKNMTASSSPRRGGAASAPVLSTPAVSPR